jgi:deoxyribodipyrimidine photo-lyase
MVNSIYLFQRALRLDDNLGLIKCLEKSDNVYPVFCVDPRQAVPKNNSFFSPYSLGFMLQSLQDLDTQLKSFGSKLYILYGEPHLVLPNLVKKHSIEYIYMNKDYTPFANKRAEQLEKLCKIEQPEDYLLFSPGSIVTGSGKAYRVYTPFLRKTDMKKVDKSIKLLPSLSKKLSKNIKPQKKAWDSLKKYSKYSPYYSPGGREEGLKRLDNINTTQQDYNKCRDYLTYNTSYLSAYIKFGCVSIREVWEAFNKVPKSSIDLKKQLIWREFYYHMYIDFPEKLEWDKNPQEVKLDKNAPDIVKACYNQLDKTGYLHNRGRMILAHYLIHNQKQYWKSCDKMYARRLVDYDPIVNIGNWLTINRLPSFKVIKPEVQLKKWDKGCSSVDGGKDIPSGSYTEYFNNLK